MTFTARRTVLVLAVIAASAFLAGCSGSGVSDGGKRTAGHASVHPDWGKALGRWHDGKWLEVPLERERRLTPAQRREFARLRSIGYLPGSLPVPAARSSTGMTGPMALSFPCGRWGTERRVASRVEQVGVSRYCETIHLAGMSGRSARKVWEVRGPGYCRSRYS